MTRGTVVLVRFPFSDLSGAKLRPAVVLAEAGRDDYILAQITRNPYADPRAVELGVSSFARCGLDRTSFARPGKLFAANAALVSRSVGDLNAETASPVVEAVVRLFRDTR